MSEQAGAPPCPFCQSSDTEPVAPFGSQLMTSQRRCRQCLSYFEAIEDAQATGEPGPLGSIA
jgi:transcriptional regulator NrdR family protein